MSWGAPLFLYIPKAAVYVLAAVIVGTMVVTLFEVLVNFWIHRKEQK